MEVGYTTDDYRNVLNMIEFAWQGGAVRSEAQAIALNNLKVKTQQLLNPKPAATTPPAGDEKKKCGKCGGDCGDCGNCGDKGKEEKKPDGPPKAKTPVEKKAEG